MDKKDVQEAVAHRADRSRAARAGRCTSARGTCRPAGRRPRWASRRRGHQGGQGRQEPRSPRPPPSTRSSRARRSRSARTRSTTASCTPTRRASAPSSSACSASRSTPSWRGWPSRASQAEISAERLDVIDTDVLVFATEKPGDVGNLLKIPTFRRAERGPGPPRGLHRRHAVAAPCTSDAAVAALRPGPPHAAARRSGGGQGAAEDGVVSGLTRVRPAPQSRQRAA